VVSDAVADAPRGLAIASLLTGMVSVFAVLVLGLGVLLGAAAVVLGVLAIRRGQPRSLAITGIVLGGLAAAASTVATVALVVSLAMNGV
jgi:hypothetical protein